jgi:two-component system chemotaxis response regulator CheY
MRILIVDDSAATRAAIAEVARRLAGAAVEEAGDGAAALKALKLAKYDLIFLDIHMPVIDGLKLLGRINQDPTYAKTKVAVFTSADHPMIAAQARGLGARYFLHKPVDRKDVERVLSEVFGRELEPAPG